MLNLRFIKDKFYLSGGWTDIYEDTEWLSKMGFKAVLDLQFSKYDYNPQSIGTIQLACEEAEIEYQALALNDGYNDDLPQRMEIAYATILDWDAKYNKRFDKILIKCGVGVSRSVAVLAYFFCRRDLLSYVEVKYMMQSADYNNYGGLPISVDSFFESFLKLQFPHGPATEYSFNETR